MKKLLISLTLLLAALTAGAQSIFNNPDNHKFLGVRLSLDVTTPSDMSIKDAHTKIDATNAGAGFSVGAIYQIPLFMNLYVEPGVTLYYNTFSIESDFVEDATGQDFNKARVREWGLAVPVVAGFHFDFGSIRVAPFTGPVFKCGLKGQLKATDNIDDWQLEGSQGIYKDGGLHRFDIAWRFGASVTWGNIMAQIYGDAGMLNAIRDDGFSSLYRNNFNIGIGYNF